MKNENWNKISKIAFRRFILSASLTIAAPVVAHATTFNYLGPLPSNNALTQNSYLDVTKSPYGVNSSGGGSATTNTTKIQNAINDAYADNLAVFFPAGTYLVNGQFDLFQVKGDMTEAHALIGSASGARPVIKLKDGSSGFGNAGNPTPLFHYLCTHDGTTNTDEQPASAYNMLFRGIDIDLGSNAGAIGVRMHAAQGSTIQDVKVTATNAFAGIEGLSGSGTIYANIEVQGGQHAFYIQKRGGMYTGGNRPMPTLVGITCIGQSSRPIEFKQNLMGPLTVVGFYIESGMTSDIFVLNATDDNEHLSLIDGSIVMTNATPVNVIYNVNRSVYLRNVHVKNGNNVVRNAQGANITTNVVDKWTHIGDYCFYKDANHGSDPRKLIDGVKDNEDWGAGSVTTNFNAPDTVDLINRHLWDELTFPHPESTAVVLGPTGSNDTSAINNAIASAETAGHNTVFLKRGDYYIDDQIHLKKDTKLIGVSRNLTRIHCVGGDSTNINTGWTEKNNSNYVPMVTTPNNTEATCTLAWLALVMPRHQGKRIHFTDWTAGRHSMVREVHFRQQIYWNGTASDIKRVLISGTGGGRWYSLFTRNGAEQGEHPDFRQVYVSGTTEPLSFYAFTIEYTEPETYMTEINSAQNVYIYGFKCETDIETKEDDPTPSYDSEENYIPDPLYYKKTPALGIVNSSDVILMGQGGHGDLDNGESAHALIEIDGTSDNIQIANASGGWDDDNGWGIVRDMVTGDKILKNGGANGGEPCAMFLIGSPNVIAYTPPSGGGGGGGGELAGLNTMEADTGNFAQHVAVDLEVTTGVGEDEWDFEHMGGDEYRIKRSGTSDYMTCFSSNWAKIKLKAESGADAQIWIAHDQGGDVYKLENKEYSNRFIVENPSNKLHAPSGYTGTDWVITAAGSPPPPPPPTGFEGLNTIQTKDTLYYAKNNGGVGTDIPASISSGDNVWEFVHVSGDDYRIKLQGVDQYINLPADNVNCTLVWGEGGDARIWTIVESNTAGKYNLINKAYPNSCLYCSGSVVRGHNNPDARNWNPGKWTITSQ